MRALMIQPDCYPVLVEIGNRLEDLQDAVDGYIEVLQIHDDGAVLVFNEEGKLRGLPFNRALRSADGQVRDYIAGDFLVVGTRGEEFTDLSDQQVIAYEREFNSPERMLRTPLFTVRVIPTPEEEIKNKPIGG